ncbi:MAG TPA: hypothetical protein VGC56_17875 [Allosphingosinicella sp.]|jgi:hypothetical protein
MYRDLRPENDALKGPDVELVFSNYVYESSPGLRKLRGLYSLVALAGIAAVIVSFFGLVLGAVDAQRRVDDSAIWIYAIVSLVILPVLYWSAPRILAWFEREYVRANLDTAAKQEALWEAFRACYSAECHLREMRHMTALAKGMTDALNKSRRVRRWARWPEKLPWGSV